MIFWFLLSSTARNEPRQAARNEPRRLLKQVSLLTASFLKKSSLKTNENETFINFIKRVSVFHL